MLPTHLRAQSSGPATPIVNELADPDNWMITGSRVVAADSIRRGLQQHPEFLAVSYPGIEEAAVLPRLKELVERGYRNLGFAEAVVNVSPRPVGTGVRIRIEEGPKYKAGRIDILGAVGIDTDRLRKWCTSVVPDAENDVVLQVDEKGEPIRLRSRNGNIVDAEDAQLDAETPDGPVWSRGAELV